MLTVDDVCTLIDRQLRGRLPDGVTLGEDTVLEELGLSSLQISDIVFTLEEEHGLEFDFGKVVDVKTIGQLVAVANESMGEGQTAAR